jgi:hypothetical protein
MKKIFMALALLFIFPVTIQAEVLYEFREQKFLAKDVIYEQNRQMTADGMLDIHILFVPLDNPFMYVGPVSSQKEQGLKESTTNLLAGTDAIAGVNGDFFGLAGTHSVPFGPVAADGRLQSITGSTNAGKNEFAAFFLGEGNVPFMQYIKADVKFFNNGRENIELGIYNRIGNNLDWPVLVDRQIMASTAELDARFPGLTKIVVENGFITYISRWGETVDIPDGGYIVIIPGHLMGKYRPLVNVGETAQFHIGNNIGLDMNRLRSAIGGGGLILANGAVVNDGGVAARGRHPRTAIGVSADRRQLILMTVDGRTHSIGATHEEMAALLARYGAYDAMHLDGGGSSTMAYRNPDSGQLTLANTTSDGAQRRVINALGVFDRAPLGDFATLGIRLSQQHVFTGTPVWAEAFGRDWQLRRMELPQNAAVTYYAEPAEGGWDGRQYTPSKAGTQTVQALYNGYNAWQYLYVHAIAELNAHPASIRTAEGLTTELRFSGLSLNGTEVAADNGVQIRVIPAELGTVQDGAFTAYRTGSGYLECALNGVLTYVPVTVAGSGQALAAFNTGMQPAAGGPVKFSGAPGNVTGWVMPESVNERSVTALHYNFEASFQTQAAYMDFEPPLIVPGAPMSLRLRVMGDGSGHWLRGQVTDGGGQRHIVDFERNVDFTDWRTVTAMLPNAPGPFTLQRIYMVETAAMETGTHRVYFDGLEALYAPSAIMEVPAITHRFADPTRVTEDAGPPTLTVPTAVSGYSVRKEGGAAIVTLTAGQGGLFETDKGQWAKFIPETNSLMPDFVVAVVDSNPLTFSQAKEFELFHKALTTHSKMNKPVFVVSAAGEGTTTLTMKDGIRYIDLARGAGNIRFWAEGNNVRWGE